MDRLISSPRPAFAPNHSPITAAVIQYVAEIFKPEKKEGRADGIAQCFNVWVGVADSIFISSIFAGSTSSKPERKLRQIGKKHIKITITIFGNRSYPNHKTNKGATVMIGIVWLPTKRG